MIKTPDTDTGRANNIVYFRPALFGSPQSKRTSRPPRSGGISRTEKSPLVTFGERHRRQAYRENVVDIKQALLSYKPTSTRHRSLSLGALGITDEARRYIRSQYIKLISRAIKSNSAARLSRLYGKYSFKMMRPEDKLFVVTEVLRLCGLEELGGNPTAGLVLCFTEAFRGGHGTRADFHSWIRLTSKSLKIQTLERFAMATGLNETIRGEANAVLVNSYIRAAEDQVIARNQSPQISFWLDDLVSKSIAILARFKPEDHRLCAFADRILRVNRIRFGEQIHSPTVSYIFSRDGGEPRLPKGLVEISLIGL